MGGIVAKDGVDHTNCITGFNYCFLMEFVFFSSAWIISMVYFISRPAKGMASTKGDHGTAGGLP
jgi:hypothetical protein